MGNKLNYKQIFAIKALREKKIQEICPNINNEPGIYFFFRVDDIGVKHGYLGQALRCKERCAAHLGEYDHIALSLKKHGFYSEENPYGYKLIFKNCPKEKLDENEIASIKFYADNGFQMLNASAGGQGKGRKQLNEYKQPKTYTEGKEAEKKRISKELAHLFDLHLDVTTKKNPPTVNQQKALDKFNELLEYHKDK